MRIACLVMLLILSPVRVQGQGFNGLSAPRRLELHEGAKVGDWLLSETTTRGRLEQTIRVIAAKKGADFLVDFLSPEFRGYVLRLQVDPTGAVRGAKACLLGKKTWQPVGLLPEVKDRAAVVREPGGEEEILLGKLGKVRCRRIVEQSKSTHDVRVVKWFGLKKPYKGVLLRQKMSNKADTIDAAIELSRIELSSFKLAETTIQARVIYRVHKVSGVVASQTEEWFALKPLFFQTKLLKLKSGVFELKVASQGRGNPGLLVDKTGTARLNLPSKGKKAADSKES